MNVSEKHLSFACPMQFEEMPSSENGRFCHKCSKEVFDLTDCSLDDVIALQKKHGSICGAVRNTAVIAAAAASLASCKTTEPEIVGPGEGIPTGVEPTIIAGGMCPPEELQKAAEKSH